MSTDIELLDRFIAGDQEAFNTLMRTHEDRVFAIALRMMRNRDAALDATQETFLTLYRKADRFHRKSAFSTWLYRVTINTCYDQLRKQKRRKADALPESNDPADIHSEDELIGAELRPDLARALAELPEDFRSAVVLSDFEGHSLETVAKILEVPVGTVKSRVFRGRRLLAQKLGNLSVGSKPQKDDHG
ncbi:MAG: sigma-70 family RNA polymerase sigma factor [Acidimicrobiia bacterium]|nr:sigma-70 family RNA polymerase sigma factor [Acidimicrobiia bacterium]MBT8216795.1 sigma-70 family RNA polymerase sigma factor [Acidimicrobiia bacterium]NNF11285.1 sigma-70 family RNA polymerase sigma factor [Acidimicrobiia bacterium]NNL68372.1 sigma-70 family RNA polymerase sigma factor [Acidimicrobiia bacterium]